MRKILSVLLAACLAVSLAGCSSGSNFTAGEFCSRYNDVISVLKSDKGLTSNIDKYIGVDSISTIPNSGVLLFNGGEIHFDTSSGVINSNSKIDGITVKVLPTNDTTPVGIYYTLFLYTAFPGVTSEQQDQIKDYYIDKANSLPELDNMEIIDSGYGVFKARYGKKSGVNYLGKYSDSDGDYVELSKHGQAVFSIMGLPTDYIWTVNDDVIEIFSNKNVTDVFCKGVIKDNTIAFNYLFGEDVDVEFKK